MERTTVHKRTMAAVAIGTLGLSGLSAGTAFASDPIKTKTTLNVGGHTSDYVLTIKDGQYPSDILTPALSAQATYENSGTHLISEPPATFTYLQNGAAPSRRFKACETTFTATMAPIYRQNGSLRFKSTEIAPRFVKSRGM